MRKFPTAVVVCIAALSFTTVRAQTGSNVEAEIQKVEDAWAKAATSNDQAALNNILAPRLVYTHSTGLIESKQEYMKAVDSFQKYKSITFENTRVNVYGNAAIVNTKVRMVGTTRGKPFNDQLLLIHVWVKEGGKWQLAAHQTTKLNP
jgi:ketosteroid isomerase-like protein